ncbi:hypothetical protein TPHA_0A03160 [Tetrapisispora phaffii CBS 4417]|uniref:R3H domain-containing protein n=1 Tax=Tetrapisispora phaffii (strain ATCC 24235 / CBS 4417 / NBRC 1672 / NRRL Y-8282 / UCD 70-5) TaxID=1071381 RepID=G8BNB5_TETPH|nr:hypothetical protein TPHA_0A03160 [Tetrapisispora phaffii CBS 4417]CCE61393.1 hypothetical protein TPHA_0A03160 [Tetrapisispora phaffii CBS 4417]
MTNTITVNQSSTNSSISDKDGDQNISKVSLSTVLSIALFQKPYDRHFILYMENSILNFLNSRAQSMELEPMNSYYRLLSYQVADYHNLKHNLLSNNNSIIVYKSDKLVLNNVNPLLQHLEPSMIKIFELPEQNNKYVTDDTIIQEMNGSKIKVNNLKIVDEKNTGSKKYKILKKEHSDCDANIDSNSNDDNDLSTSFDSNNERKRVIDVEKERLKREEFYEERKRSIYEDDDNMHNDEVEENEGKKKSFESPKSPPYHEPSKKNENSDIFQDDFPHPNDFETSRYNIDRQKAEYKYSKKRQYQPHKNGYKNHSKYSANQNNFNGYGDYMSNINFVNEHNFKKFQYNPYTMNSNMPEMQYSTYPFIPQVNQQAVKLDNSLSSPYMMAYNQPPYGSMAPNVVNNIPIQDPALMSYDAYNQPYYYNYNAYYNPMFQNNQSEIKGPNKYKHRNYKESNGKLNYKEKCMHKNGNEGNCKSEPTVHLDVDETKSIEKNLEGLSIKDEE